MKGMKFKNGPGWCERNELNFSVYNNSNNINNKNSPQKGEESVVPLCGSELVMILTSLQMSALHWLAAFIFVFFFFQGIVSKNER